MNERGKRIYEAAVAWFGLQVGESATLHVNGDLIPDGGGIVLENGRLIVNAADGVALAEYLQQLSQASPTQPFIDAAAASIRLSAGGEAAVRALTWGEVDPGERERAEGELRWNELRARCATSDQGLARITNRLRDDGLVEPEGWDGSKYGVVRLTDLGKAVARHRNYYPCSPRT